MAPVRRAADMNRCVIWTSRGAGKRAGHDIYEHLEIERLGHNARERSSLAARAFAELGLSQDLARGR
jgi:hypothetical protein